MAPARFTPPNDGVVNGTSLSSMRCGTLYHSTIHTRDTLERQYHIMKLWNRGGPANYYGVHHDLNGGDIKLSISLPSWTFNDWECTSRCLIAVDTQYWKMVSFNASVASDNCKLLSSAVVLFFLFFWFLRGLEWWKWRTNVRLHHIKKLELFVIISQFCSCYSDNTGLQGSKTLTHGYREGFWGVLF